MLFAPFFLLTGDAFVVSWVDSVALKKWLFAVKFALPVLVALPVLEESKMTLVAVWVLVFAVGTGL